MAGRKIKNRVGQKFGRLKVVSLVGQADNGYALWLCKCDCGNTTTVRSGNLQSGITKSCGCLKIEKTKETNKTHGLKKTRLYRIWRGMKCRCLNPNDKAYYRYGGKGVLIYSEWVNDFMAFNNWALSNGYQDVLTIDRINPNGNYEPSNCQWISRGDNAKRAHSIFITVHNMTDSLNGWSKIINISGPTLSTKLKKYGEKYLENFISKNI